MSGQLNWEAIGDRLSLLRLASGYKQQKTFADLLEASHGQYNHWERGRQIIPVEYAARVCSHTDATLDYIYLGRLYGLSTELRLKIRALLAGRDAQA